MKNKTVFIYESSTCNRRKLDASKLNTYFLKNKYQVVNNPKDADIIILVTCAYSNKHAELSFQYIKELLKYNSKLIIIGCLPGIEKEKLKIIFNGETITTDKLERIDEIFPENSIKFKDIKDANILWENRDEYLSIYSLKRVFGKINIANKIYDSFSNCILENVLLKKSFDLQHNVFNYLKAKSIKEKWNPSLKVQKDFYYIRPCWGCLGNCTYCVIKNAIGSLKSKPLNIIIKEFDNGLKLNYKNIIFDADDLGAYGIDIDSNLPTLLDKITNIQGEYNIHIRNVHPVWVVKYFKQLSKILKKGKIRGFGCSIQSGNPRVLKLMQRYSDIDKIRNTFYKLIESHPNILLATECINGFPTETKEEFKNTLDFIKDIDFSIGYIFPFSSRPNTIAEKITPKITNDEISSRMKYAKNYLKNKGYKISLIKNYNILFFSKPSLALKLDNGTKSFCVSTID